MGIICGIVDSMENKETEKKPQKSTLLFVLFLFLLFNAAHLFRTSINTLYFAEDTSGDYAAVEATLIEFRPDTAEKVEEEPPQLTPVFSFRYKEEEMTMEAPDFAFDQDKLGNQPFAQGEEYVLWVHKRWGKLILPPIMGQEELGRSQLRISALFLFLAVGIWILRNKLAKKQSIS
jgi:hypothetical protein